MKTIFWKQGHSEISCAPCPFLGVQVASVEEFVKIIQTRLFKVVNKENNTGYYPPIVFGTKYDSVSLIFRGSYDLTIDVPINPSTNNPYKWFTMDKRNHKPIDFYAKKDFDKMFELFEDSVEVDAKVAMVDRIVRETGGLIIDLNA